MVTKHEYVDILEENVTTIGVRELRSRVGEVLRRVAEGRERVLVTRHGKPSAQIIPVQPTGKKRGKVLRGSCANLPDLSDEDFARVKEVWTRAVE